MITRIENGVTIISTGDAEGGIKNKNGHKGIHYVHASGKFRCNIHHKKKYYHLGISHNITDLVEIRKEAEQHIKDGDFEEWYQAKRREWGWRERLRTE